MALQMRRVITGHDETGRAIVKIDDVVGNSFEGRPGAATGGLWVSAAPSRRDDPECRSAIHPLRKAGR